MLAGVLPPHGTATFGDALPRTTEAASLPRTAGAPTHLALVGSRQQVPLRAAVGAICAAPLLLQQTHRRRWHGQLSRRLVAVCAKLPRGEVEVEMEAIADAMALAAKAEKFENAARLRDRLRELEAQNPGVALALQQERRIRSAVDRALLSSESMAERITAIDALVAMASPPMAASGAEDALHKILLYVSGADADAIREASEQALWKVWQTSGDPDVDEELLKGIDLLEKQRVTESVQAFTTVTGMAPQYAEGWNKRATALYGLKHYDRSIEDCLKVLELKPKHFGCLSGLGMCHLSKGDESEAVRWFKAALRVHPGMEGARQVVDRVELPSLVEAQLEPEMSRVVRAFKEKVEVPVRTGNGLSCSWDVHRMEPKQEEGAVPWVYFFRVRIRNDSCDLYPLRSLARYYVLQFTNRRVVPFTRITDGSAQFKLEAGQEYKFCWALIVGHELQCMAMGTLLERLSPDDEEKRFLHGGMQPLLPIEAPKVPMHKAEQLGDGYYYTGQLDLRRFGNL